MGVLDFVKVTVFSWFVIVYSVAIFFIMFAFWTGWGVGKKCKYCKCRSVGWIQWHQMGKEDYRGWIWCPVCFHKKWEGFQDRVFG